MARQSLDRWIASRLGAILLASAALGLMVAMFLIHQRFDDIERWLVDRQLDRLERVVSQELDAVERSAVDYAQWDDTLDYVRRHNRRYVETNFQLSTGGNLNLDWMLISDLANQPLVSVDFNGERNFVPLASDEVASVLAALPAAPSDDRSQREAGLFVIDGVPTVVARSAISNSDQTEPAVGNLWFGRRLTEDELLRLAGLADVSFALRASDDPESARVVERVAQNRWVAHSPIAEGHMVASIEVPALLSQEFITTGWLLALATALNVAICVVWMRWELRRKVIRRLHAFAELSERYDPRAPSQQRWPVHGDDDIDALAQALNRMGGDLRDKQASLDRLARVDSLTGLSNRLQLIEMLQARAEQWDEVSPAQHCLVFIDLDGFKEINDAFGHSAGDAVLSALAERMRALGPPVVCAARIGGDEFALLLEGLSVTESTRWLRAQMDGLAQPISVDQRQIRFDLAAGVAPLSPGADALSWLRASDLAMYAAKRHHEERVFQYDPIMLEAARVRRHQVDALARAIEADDLEVWFQRSSMPSRVTSPRLKRWPGGSWKARGSPPTCSSGWQRKKA